jgi:hypothetical protein
MKAVFFVAFATALASAGVAPALAQSASATPSCAAGDPVVWENSSSKVYHLQGDSYYGKTKHGAYACKSAADAAGYHVSGSKSSKGSSTSSPAPASDSMASPSAMSSAKPAKHHHHRKSSASPAPGAMGSPAPSST